MFIQSIILMSGFRILQNPLGLGFCLQKLLRYSEEAPVITERKTSNVTWNVTFGGWKRYSYTIHHQRFWYEPSSLRVEFNSNRLRLGSFFPAASTGERPLSWILRWYRNPKEPVTSKPFRACPNSQLKIIKEFGFWCDLLDPLTPVSMSSEIWGDW